ncbi:cadherin-like beta sandwich domain-containing protein [Paenibacillus sp. HJGM_3]|uniref:cadherin-like beta sandwich domain-containing protein n=1 Tax=Paenibacillus sp. HJGM_3 TaxID=3379816 RepID=UPI00385E45D2
MLLFFSLAFAAFAILIEPPRAHAASAITIDSPTDGASVGSGKLRISGSYSGLYDIKLYINGTRQVDAITNDPDADDSGTWHYDLDTSPYNGPIQLRVRGLDTTTRYGIWSPTVRLTVDNKAAAAPIVQIVSPMQGVSLHGEVPIRVSVQSDAVIDQVEVRINGGAWQATAKVGDDYGLVWNTAGIGDKTSSIEARAYNEYGIKGTSLTTYAKVGAGTNETLVVPAQNRAMWLWEAATYNILLNPGSREVLDAMAKDTATFGSDPVKVLYFAVGPFDGMDVMEDHPEILRDFIAWAHERGYQVQACIAGGTSPPYMGAYREFHDTAIRHFEQVLNFNISSAPEERFDGVNVDVEPYISPDFKDTYPSLQVQYLELIEKMIERRNATGLNLPFGPAIPKWYDSSEQARDITFNGQTKWLSEHIQDMTDYIAIMDYRDTADGTAGIIAGAQGEIDYANLIGKPNSVVIGVETLDIANSGDPETITFREEGRNVMEAELDKVYAAFGDKSSFGGIAMHHYDSIRALPSHWGPDGILWLPMEDNVPPTAPSRYPAAKAVDHQSVTLTFGRAYDNTEVNHYVIYRSTQPDFTAHSGNAVGTARSLNFKDNGLLPSTTYYYKVAAVDVRGNVGPASEQAKITTGASTLKPMIITSMKVERSGANATVTLQVADMLTRQPISANVEGRFTFAGGKYVYGKAVGGQVSLTSEVIPAGYQIGFEPRRILAEGYYWAQAYDIPHMANVNPRVRLSDLGISQGSLTTPFAPDKAHYVTVVAEDITSIKVTPTAESPTTSVKVNGVPVQSGAASQAIPLAPGENMIVIQTIAEDATTDSYTVKVIRTVPVDNVFLPTDDAYVFEKVADRNKNDGFSPYLNVQDITAANGGGDFITYFKFDLGLYTIPVNSVTLNVYSAYPVDKNVKIDVIGYPSTEWKESTLTFNNRPLANPVPIGSFVVRDSGWYSIDVTSFVQTRMGLDQDRKMTLRFIINDIPNSSGTLVQFHSKESSTNQPFLLVNESSDASLAKLTTSDGVLTPDFNPERFSYTATVSDSVYGITLTPTVAESHARVKVNGQPVGSGTTSQEIPLVLGVNPPITVEVTAQDGTTAVYTVTFVKEKSSNADLNSLALIGGKLDQPFAPDLTVYTAEVASSIDAIRVEAMPADPDARVWVNGTPISSEGLSAELPLTEGDNEITVRVEAPSGNSKTYSITVTRKPPVYSTDLKELQITGITFTPDFQPNIVSYTSSVVHSISDAEVRAVTVDPRTELYINGKRALGGEVVPIALQVGLNRLEIKVQAPDLLEQVYVVNVTRQEDESSETIDSLIQLLSRYAAENEVRGPLVYQLREAADQAKHHYDIGNSKQGIRHLENLLKYLNNNSMQGNVSSAAKAAIQAYVSALIESWSKLT